MNSEQSNINKIIKLAEDCSKILSNNQYPINIENIINELEGRYIYLDNIDYDIKITNENNFTIYINKNFKKFTNDFILSLGIGHLFLNMGFMTDKWNDISQYIVKYRYGFIDDYKNSYMFATHFMMPYNIFYRFMKQCSNEYDMVDTKKMSNMFNINTDIILSHGKYLGLFYY